MSASRLLSGLLLLLALPAAAHANVILDVNISDPTAVEFSSTTANADATFIDIDSAFNGITLLGFLPGNTVEIDTPLGATSDTIGVFDTSAGTTRSSLVNIWVGVWPGGWSPGDVSFYEPIDLFPVSFFDDARALIGGATHNLSGFGGLGLARSGDIVVGEPDAGFVVGQWRVVPEPGTLVLLMIGMLAAVGTLRRDPA